MSFLGLMLLQGGLRHRWRSWLVLALLTGLVIGLVLAGAATARRTATAFPRFAAAHGYDAFLYSVQPVSKLSALPQVASVTLLRNPVSGAPDCACTRPIDVNDFSVDEVSPARLSQMVKLLSGHMPVQSDPSQVLASSNLEQLGVHLGSVLQVPLAAASQKPQVLSNANFTPSGPRVTVHVVGFEISEVEFPTASNEPSYDIYPTTTFARDYNAKSVVLYEYYVRLRRGAADLPRFQSEARSIGGLSPTDLDALANSVTTSIEPQAVGWWILTALAGLVGLLILAQALMRQAAVEAESYPVLIALGATRRQRFALTMVWTAGIATVGAAIGVLVAALLSFFVPVGEARLADPSPGFDFDPLLLVGGAALAAVVVVALGTWPAAKTSRARWDRDDEPVRPPSPLVAFLSSSGAPPSALIGIRSALERGRGRRAVPVGSAVLGAVLAVTALCGTAVFGASLGHLTSTPSEYGQAFDAWFAVNGTGTTAQNDKMLAAVEHRPGISAITAGTGGVVTINGKVVDAIAGQSLRGPLTVTVTKGRFPVASDEVVLGSKTLRLVGAQIGSRVRVAIPSSSGGGTQVGTFRVVGTAVLPSDFNDQGLGTGAAFTLGGLLAGQCHGTADASCLLRSVVDRGGAYLVRVAPGKQGEAALAGLSRDFPSAVNTPTPPINLVNFGEAVNFPLIFGVVVGLFGVATLLHLLIISLNRRRQEMGLLKSLGFVRRQIALSVSWQTTTVAFVGVLVGVPLGIATGRWVWDAFATNLGVAAQPVVTVWVIAAVAAATLAVANLLAVVPAIIAARAPAATLLKAE